jgi:hypothetical protein
MSKKEIIWREILYQTVEKKRLEFTQKELSRKFGFSLSTIFNALKLPRESGAIEVTGRNFVVRNAEKFLYLWATHRSIGRETIYQTSVAAGPGKIEGMMPPGAVFAGYSAYAKKYADAPADYDKVYVYADAKDINEIKRRFPPKKGRSNLFVLKGDSALKKFGNVTSDIQTFVDIWNLSDWYARDFLEALKRKILN